MSKIIPIQRQFCQELPQVNGNADYTEFRNTLLRIEEIIHFSQIDHILINTKFKEAADLESKHPKYIDRPYKGLSVRRRRRIQVDCVKALRLSLAQRLLDMSYRNFACRLADSPLLQRFCQFDTWGETNIPSKSALHRYEQSVPEPLLREIINQLNLSANEAKNDDDLQCLGLSDPISMADYYLDTTCLKANIHFPVDWLLLRDGVLTLMKAVTLVRNRGLKNRMDDPVIFMREINKQCIAMTHTRRKKNARRMRKLVLRTMKRICKQVMRHAEKHRALLAEHWEMTDLSQAESAQIISRIDNVLLLLPDAMHQAHERIIGERKVLSKGKILSLYEDDICVLSRGKSGAEVEFGNTFLVGEQADGLIVDWKLYKESKSDTAILSDSIERIKSFLGDAIKSVTGDRGFDSKKNRAYLEAEKIDNCLCPRSVSDLKERLKDDAFREHQTRRAQTEARIAILKNKFLGKPLRSKGFESRERSVAWAVLTHNLWVLARLPVAKEKTQRQAS